MIRNTMDPIDYTELPSAPPDSLPVTPLSICIICGQRAPRMFFPCGCTHPIHGKCLPIWRQYKGECAGCGSVWIDIVPPVVEAVLPAPRLRNMWCGYEYSCIASFLCCIVAVAGLGAVTFLYPIHNGEY